jgi:hypothetical protein
MCCSVHPTLSLPLRTVLLLLCDAVFPPGGHPRDEAVGSALADTAAARSQLQLLESPDNAQVRPVYAGT